MKEHPSHLVTLFPLLANAAALHTVFVFFSYARTSVSDHMGMLIWWGCLTLTHAALTLFLRRPRSLRGVILITAGGFLMQLILTLVFAQRHATFLAWFAILFMWIGLYVRCCSQLFEGTKPESVVAAFETTTLVLFVAALSVSLSTMSPGPLLHAAAGILLSLIALARVRSGHARIDSHTRHNQKGRLLLVGLLVGLGGGVTLFCVLFASSASQLLTRFTQWVFSVFLTIYHAFGRFFRWLVSLLPEQHVDESLLAGPEEQLPSGMIPEAASDNGALFYLLMGSIVVFALAALVWIWRRGGFHHISFRSRPLSRATRKSRSPVSLLLQLWQRLCGWSSFQISYLQQRNTVPGLFVWLERQMRARHLERQKSETPRVFLTRIRETLPQSTETLILLADCLDQHYFGTGHGLSAVQIAAMRKQLRSELHQH